jgi:hypothetical protein
MIFGFPLLRKQYFVQQVSRPGCGGGNATFFSRNVAGNERKEF